MMKKMQGKQKNDSKVCVSLRNREKTKPGTEQTGIRGESGVRSGEMIWQKETRIYYIQKSGKNSG